jgi:hypothetical protein
MSTDQGIITTARHEAGQLAHEIHCVLRRIEKGLPIRKLDVKANLREVARPERSALQAVNAFQCARDSTRCGHKTLDELSMIRMGGQADVTAGLELTERLDEVLGNLLALMAESAKSDDDGCGAAA